MYYTVQNFPGALPANIKDFVAVVGITGFGSTMAAMSNDNGATWNAETLSASRVWRCVEYSPTLDLYCAGNINDGIVSTSSNGVTWTSHDTGLQSVQSIAWSPALGIFCAHSANAQAATSADGSTWTLHATAGTGLGWREMVWSAGLGIFCAITSESNNPISSRSRSETSADGATWTLHDGFGFYDGLYGLAWSPALAIFCAVDGQGLDSSYHNSSWTSADGITWTQHANLPITHTWNDICWSPELGLFCAIATNPPSGSPKSTLAVTSPDGINWTSRTLPANGWKGITWNGTVFCAVGHTDGLICTTSPDGVNWTAHNMPSQNGWWDIISKYGE